MNSKVYHMFRGAFLGSYLGVVLCLTLNCHIIPYYLNSNFFTAYLMWKNETWDYFRCKQVQIRFPFFFSWLIRRCIIHHISIRTPYTTVEVNITLTLRQMFSVCSCVHKPKHSSGCIFRIYLIYYHNSYSSFCF